MYFFAVPGFIRDAVYDIIVNNRYRWFGKSDSCMVPTPELAKKVLKRLTMYQKKHLFLALLKPCTVQQYGHQKTIAPWPSGGGSRPQRR